MKFTEFFNIQEENLEFLDIDLDGDYPFFIDPLLLKFSKEIPESYEDFLNYFDKSDNFNFKEIKETHLGFGYFNNKGKGIGKKKGENIKNNYFLKKYNYDLDTIEIFMSGIGIDSISDMTTNIILEHLLKFTEKICKKYNVKTIIKREEFYNGEIKEFEIPTYKENYIILVPLDVLRKDTNLISRSSFVSNIFNVLDIKENSEMRMNLNNLLYKEDKRKNGKVETKQKNQKEINESIKDIINKEPNIIMAYKKYIEEKNPKTNITKENIKEHSDNISASENLSEVLKVFLKQEFKEGNNLLDLTRNFIHVYKDQIEKTDLVKIFNIKENTAEKFHQKFIRTLSIITELNLNAEVDNGNGPVDFKIIKNNEGCLIEVKLMRNSKVNNVYKQVESYLSVNKDSDYAFVILIAYTEEELEKAENIKKENENESIEVIIINCNPDNYISSSNKK